MGEVLQINCLAENGFVPTENMFLKRVSFHIAFLFTILVHTENHLRAREQIPLG